MFSWKRAVILVTAVLMMVWMISPVGASEVMSGEVVTVPAGSVKGPLFVSGNNVVIDADVDGDVFAAGDTITVNGRIAGDLLTAARNLNINSAVAGDIRCLAQNVDIKGEAGQSLTAACSVFRGMSSSQVARDATIFAANVDLSGTVGRDLLGSTGNVGINGNIGGDVNLWQVQELKLNPTAVVGGSLTYRSPVEAAIAPGAKITGARKWDQVVNAPVEKRKWGSSEGFDWVNLLVGFAAGVLIWGIIALLLPKMWIRLSQVIEKEPWPVLGWGLLALLLTPLAVVLFLITVIGIPISLLLLVAYLVLLAVSKIIVGDALGRFLAQRFGWVGRVPAVLPFMIGFLAIKLLSNIPVAGFLLSVAVMCTAIGAVVMSIYYWRKSPEITPSV